MCEMGTLWERFLTVRPVSGEKMLLLGRKGPEGLLMLPCKWGLYLMTHLFIGNDVCGKK